MRAINLINQRFGSLIVLSETPKDQRTGTRKNRPQWLCLCDCGIKINVAGWNLTSGNTKSCGCFKKKESTKRLTNIARQNKKQDPNISVAKRIYNNYKNKHLSFEQFYQLSQINCYFCDKKPSNFSNIKQYPNHNFYYNGLFKIDYNKDYEYNNVVSCCKNCSKSKTTQYYSNKRHKSLIGQKFGRLTVIAAATDELKKIKNKTWKCKCDCGSKIFKYLPTSKLISGATKSCGCLKKELAAKQFKNINENRERGNPINIAATIVYNESYKDGDISFNEFYNLSQQKCHYCGCLPVSKRVYASGLNYATRDNCTFIYNGLDRKDSSLGHMLENVVPCCIHCNLRKRNIPYDIFLNMIKNIATKPKTIYDDFNLENIKQQMIKEEFILNKNNKWRKTEKGKGLYNRFGNYKDADLTIEQFLYLIQYDCHYCGQKPNNYFKYNNIKYYYSGLDRKDQSKPHFFNNIVPCCKECNLAKTKLTEQQFINWAKIVYNNLFIEY